MRHGRRVAREALEAEQRSQAAQETSNRFLVWLWFLGFGFGGRFYIALVFEVFFCLVFWGVLLFLFFWVRGFFCLDFVSRDV